MELNNVSIFSSLYQLVKTTLDLLSAQRGARNLPQFYKPCS